jgi:hypothetical protein
MPDLKLIALESDDLDVISAHLQDAVVRLGDMTYLPGERRFAVVANRFDWAKALGGDKIARGTKGFERRRTGLRFERVLAARVQGLNLMDKSATLALLAITFHPKSPEAVDGDVTLTFSGGAAIRLEVECLEVELTDLGAAWAAKRAPAHPGDKA